MAEFRQLHVFVLDKHSICVNDLNMMVSQCIMKASQLNRADASGCIKNNFPSTMVWQIAFFPDNKDSKQQHLASSQEPNCLLSTIESSFILLPLLGAPIPGDTALQ